LAEIPSGYIAKCFAFSVKRHAGRRRLQPGQYGHHARRHGDEQAARRASITGGFLIGIMILTLLPVSIGLLWPEPEPTRTSLKKG